MFDENSNEINLRFVCCTWACFAFLAVGMHFLHEWQVRRESGLIWDKAQEAADAFYQEKGPVADTFNQGNWQDRQAWAFKAIDLYGRYLLLVPKDTDAEARYGSLLYDCNEPVRASRAFEAVLRRDPENSEVRRKAVRADMAIGRTQDARFHLENYLLKAPFLATLSGPDAAELHDLEGVCLARAGENLAAGRSFQAAIERDPTHFMAYTQLIAILSKRRGDLEKDREKWLASLPKDLRLALQNDPNPTSKPQSALKQDSARGNPNSAKRSGAADWAEKTADYWSDRLVAANPNDPRAFVFRGGRRYAKQILAGAIQDAESALKLKPDNRAALLLAALSCLAAGQPDKARAYAARGINPGAPGSARTKTSPTDPAAKSPNVLETAELYDILAEVDRARPDEAIKWLQKAVDADGPPQHWWKLGKLQIATGKFDAARQTAQSLRKKIFPLAAQIAASPAASPGNLAQAAAAWVDPDLYAGLLEADIEQAQGHWSEAIKKFSLAGSGLMSLSYFTEGERGQNGNAGKLATDAFYALGKCYEQLADPEQALKAYRRAVDADPLSVPARQAVAATLQSLSRTGEALEEQGTLAKLKDAPPDAKVTFILWSIAKTAGQTTQKRGWRGVEDLINQLAESAPQSPIVTLLRAELLTVQQRGPEAENLLDSERIKNPKEIAFWIALVNLAIHDNRWDRARQTLEEAEKRFGDRVELRRARALYLMGAALAERPRGNIDKAAALAGYAGNNIDKAAGEKGAAREIGKLAEKSKNISTQDQVQLWRDLMSAARAIDDFPLAGRLCRLIMAQSPSDLFVRMDLFDIAAQANDVTLMDSALDEIHRIEGSGPIWHFKTAWRLIFSDRASALAGHAPDYIGKAAGDLPAAEPALGRREEGETRSASPSPPLPVSPSSPRAGMLREALDHLAEARRLRPNWSRALQLEGMIYQELRQEDAALAKYLEAIQRGENSPEVARRALQLLYDKREYAKANDLFRQLESQQVPFTAELFRDESRVLGGLRDYAGALKAAQRAAAQSLQEGRSLPFGGSAGKNYRDFLWLGQLQFILGQRQEAEKSLIEANTLDEKAPEALVALVEFFFRTGQKDRAQKALADGREKIPAADAPLALAECLEILGDTSQAGQQYVLALKQKPNDPGVVRGVANYYVRQGDLSKAADQFLRIVAGQVRGTPQQVAEARRELALIRENQGGYQNLLAAIGLVDENLAVPGAPGSADNLRLKARLLAVHPQLSKRREGLAILEKLVGDSPNSIATASLIETGKVRPADVDRFRLAQLYLAFGEWTKARPQMLALLAAQSDQPLYVAGYAQALLAHQEFDEAGQWIDRLEELAPDTFGAVRLRAAVQLSHGNSGGAIGALTKFIEKAPAGSADRRMRTLAAANELEAFSTTFDPGSAEVQAAKSRSAVGDDQAVPAALAKAEELYRKCVQEDPKQGLVLVAFLGRQKRFDEALTLAEEACKTAEPRQITAIGELLLGKSGITAPQVERLARILAVALKKNDRALPLLMVLAETRANQEKYAEAEALYREVLRADGHAVLALNNLAGLFALSRRHLDEAKDLIERAITEAGPHPNLLDTRASVYLALGQAQMAVDDMQKVLADQPAATRYFHLALAQLKLGRKADAADSLLKARTLQIRLESLHPLERPVYAELVRTLL